MRRGRVLAGVVVLVVLLAGLAVVVLGHGAAGPILATVPAGALPVAAAVDEATGRAFVVNREGNNVSMLDTRTGKLLRTVAVGYSPAAVAVDQHSNRVFVADNSGPGTGYSGRVVVLDGRSGDILRTVALRHTAAVQALALDEGLGRLFVAGGPTVSYGNAPSTGGSVSVLDLPTGRVLHTASLPAGYIPSALTVDGRTERVFVVNYNVNSDAPTPAVDSAVSILDARSGRILGRVRVDLQPGPPAVDERAGRIFVASAGGAPSYGASSFFGHVALLDARSGQLLRTARVTGLWSPQVAVDAASGHAFVLSNLRTARLTLPPTSGAATPFIMVSRGEISMLDTRSGHVLRSTAVPGTPFDLAVDAQAGRVIVDVVNLTVRDGALLSIRSLCVLDARSGALLRTVPAGPPIRLGVGSTAAHTLDEEPNGVLAVDEQTGHVVVTTDGGTVPGSDAWGWVPGWLRRLLPFLPSSAPHVVPPGLSTVDVSG